jgi:hypothetical protein
MPHIEMARAPVGHAPELPGNLCGASSRGIARPVKAIPRIRIPCQSGRVAAGAVDQSIGAEIPEARAVTTGYELLGPTQVVAALCGA